jgi:hypothetical protein
MTASNHGPSGAKPRVIRYERKRLALLGNQRAVKHGYYCRSAREARWAKWQALLEEDRRRSAEWARTIPQTDYGAICEAIDRERREKEASP